MFHNTLYIIYQTIQTVVELVNLAILIYVVCTWIAPMGRVRYTLERFLNPVFAPFRPLGRMVMQRFGIPLDFTVLFTMLGLDIASRILTRLFVILFRFL